jgi:hypothetical protein
MRRVSAEHRPGTDPPLPAFGGQQLFGGLLDVLALGAAALLALGLAQAATSVLGAHLPFPFG